MAGEREGGRRLPDEVVSSLGLDAGEASLIESGRASQVLRCAAHPASLAAIVPAEVTLPPPTPLALIELIRGEIDAFYADCCQVWDHAPWILLVEEAGGAFTDHDGGHAPDRRGGLYSNREIHQVLLERLPDRERRS